MHVIALKVPIAMPIYPFKAPQVQDNPTLIAL